MTWDNHGIRWHIDHVIPCDSFNLKTGSDKDIYKCFNWKNTKPMYISDNLSKSNKLIWGDIFKQKLMVRMFMFDHNIYEKLI